MIGSTGRRAGATVAAIALAGAGAFASAPLASAAPAVSPQACLDSVENARFNDTLGQFLLGGLSPRKQSAWDITLPADLNRAEWTGIHGARKDATVVYLRGVGTNSLSASAEHDSAACKGAVMTFGFSKADGTRYRNVFVRNVGGRHEPARKPLDKGRPASPLFATLPIVPTDTGEWKLRQVAVRQGGQLVVKPISDVSTQVRRASNLGGVLADRPRLYDRKLVVLEKGRALVAIEEGRARIPGKRGPEAVTTIVKGDLVGITGHLTTISNRGRSVGLESQPIVLQARKGGAKGTWQTVLVEQRSTHANGYYLLQIKRAKVAGQELRLHYPSPYQSIAKSWQYLGKIR